MGLAEVDLTQHEPSALRSAVSRTLEQAPTNLGAGARAVKEASETKAATYFVSLLEVGYLVASADGFAETERHALADLLEQATGKAVVHDELDLHFRDLEDACQMLGRRERLRRAAADFDDTRSHEEAVGFAALVSLGDGRLDSAEAAALSELGSHFGFDEARVNEIVSSVVSRVRAALA
jgi:tellurite resistance protein